MLSITSLTLYVALAPLVVAVLIVSCLWLPGPRKTLPSASDLIRGSRPDAAAKAVLGVSATLVLLYSVTDGLRSLWGFGINSGIHEYRWWTYADVLLSASVVVLCVLVLLRGFKHSSAVRVAPSRPRTWRSFTRTGRLWSLLTVTVVLLGFVAFAGSVSSPDSEGIYNTLTIDAGGHSTASTIFFGWAYGLPVAGAALLLVALSLATIHINAVRPFFRPETVTQEAVSRSMLTTLILWFSTGVLLDTLARALLQVSQAGVMSMQAQGFTWETSVAALSPSLQWVSYALESIGYIFLLLVLTVAVRPRRGDATAEQRTTHGKKLESHG